MLNMPQLHFHVSVLQHENPWTIPNLLCVCRIVLSPYLGYLIIHQHFTLSLALFTLAGATDLVKHTHSLTHSHVEFNNSLDFNVHSRWTAVGLQRYM